MLFYCPHHPAIAEYHYHPEILKAQHTTLHTYTTLQAETPRPASQYERRKNGQRKPKEDIIEPTNIF